MSIRGSIGVSSIVYKMREIAWDVLSRGYKINKGNIYWRKLEHQKRSGGMNDMKRACVSDEDVGDRVKWKLSTMMADTK